MSHFLGKWFFANGDSPFFFLEQLRELSFFPVAFDRWSNLGMSVVPRLWLDYPFRLITVFLFRLGISWFFVDKIWWIGVFILAFISAYQFSSLYIKDRAFRIVGSLIYSTNTYFLLIFGGGQLGIALAFALFPFAYFCCITLFDKAYERKSLNNILITTLMVALLLASDLRIGFMFVLLVCLSVLYLYFSRRLQLKRSFFFIPFLVVLIHLYWLMPLLISFGSVAQYQKQYSQSSGLSFFSVANFTHALSLLHPNWPENLFGRVYFFRPEFLLIPLLAFGFLLSKKKYAPDVLFMGCIGILGAFLAKGVNEPFGVIYELLFKYVPGFSLFRDPTKWYLFVALAYSILIPITLLQIKYRKLAIVSFCAIWIFSLRLLFLGSVQGNFTQISLPSDYQKLEIELSGNTSFFRTLWLPTTESISFSNSEHPIVTADEMFHESSVSGIVRNLQNLGSLSSLKNEGIRYIIIPSDINHRIFLDDYIFDQKQRNTLISSLKEFQIQQKSEYASLAVFDLGSNRDLFTLGSQSATIVSWNIYTSKVEIPARQDSEILTVLYSYDPLFRLHTSFGVLSPMNTKGKYIEFLIPKGEKEEVILTYLPEEYARTGAIISGLTLISLFVVFILNKGRNGTHK